MFVSDELIIWHILALITAVASAWYVLLFLAVVIPSGSADMVILVKQLRG